MSYGYEQIDASQWDALLERSPYASPFHQYRWGELIAEQVGGSFSPYVVSSPAGKWLVPIYGSMPGAEHDEAQTFSIGYGGPLAIEEIDDGEAELRSSIEVLDSLKSELGFSALRATLYPASIWPNDPNNSRVMYGLTCKVKPEGDRNQVFNETLSGNVRTAIRKAEKSNVIVRCVEADALDDKSSALELLRSTQRSVGSSYETSAQLFGAINSLDEPELRCTTYVAEVDSALVGMASCVNNSRELFHLFHGWDRSYARTCANQALIWRMLSQAIELDIPSFNMGESHSLELFKAKLRWGGQSEYVPKISLGA